MDDLDSLLISTFESLYPALLANPAELTRRLKRRRLPILLSPPRATCITLRADDTRLDDHFFSLSAPTHPDFPLSITPHKRRAALLTHGHIPHTHHLTLTKPLLERLTAPVTFPHPVPVRTAAQLLGVAEHSLRKLTTPSPSPNSPPSPPHPRKPKTLFLSQDSRGHLGVLPHQHTLLARLAAEGITDPDSPRARTLTRTGRKQLLLSPRNPAAVFDPCARNLGSSTHPAHGPLWQRNASKLPEDFSQTLTRLRTSHPSSRWSPKSEIRNPKSQMIAHPDDRHLTPSGYRWLCPQCHRPTRLLYCPVKLFTLPDYLGLHPTHPETLDLLHPPESFACKKCHRIDNAPLRNTSVSWNRFISRVTEGLLFGHEVPRPPWLSHPTFTPKPQKNPRPKLTPPKTAPRRQLILSLRQAGHTFPEIATRLGITEKSVRTTYARHKPPNSPTCPRASRPPRVAQHMEPSPPQRGAGV